MPSGDVNHARICFKIRDEYWRLAPEWRQPVHRQECFNGLGYHEGDFPEAERACRELLAFPIYPELNEEQQHYVVQAVREWFAR